MPNIVICFPVNYFSANSRSTQGSYTTFVVKQTLNKCTLNESKIDDMLAPTPSTCFGWLGSLQLNLPFFSATESMDTQIEDLINQVKKF